MSTIALFLFVVHAVSVGFAVHAKHFVISSYRVYVIYVFIKQRMTEETVVGEQLSA